MLNSLRWGMGVGVVGFLWENGVGEIGFGLLYDFSQPPTLLRSLNTPSFDVYKFSPCYC